MNSGKQPQHLRNNHDGHNGGKAILSAHSHETTRRQTQSSAVGPQGLFHIGNWKMSATSSCDSILGKPSGKLMAHCDTDSASLEAGWLGAREERATRCRQLRHRV